MDAMLAGDGMLLTREAGMREAQSVLRSGSGVLRIIVAGLRPMVARL